MIEFETVTDMLAYVGKETGVSDWKVIDQEMVDKFADTTGDHQWIHVDVERAKKEMPGGKTIVHGHLTFALVGQMAKTIYRVKKRSKGMIYGFNQVRFVSTVPVGSRVRLRQTLKAMDSMKDGSWRLTFENTVEIEGQERPAVVAEMLSVAYP